jgi:hypothetical protein
MNASSDQSQAALSVRLAEARRKAAMWRKLVETGAVTRLADDYIFLAILEEARAADLERRLAGREE